MRKIPLTKGRFALVDDADYEAMSRIKWQYHDAGYAVSRTRKTGSIYMHRLLMKATPDIEVDHRDRISEGN